VRRRQFVQLVLVAVVLAAAATVVAVVIPWLPESASEQRDRIDVTFWLATAISIFIFAVVVSVIVFSILKFRARDDDDTDGPPIHGHTGLEIFWTAVPFVLVTAIAVLSAVVLHENSVAGRQPLTVRVTAEQFVWRFEYLNGTARGVVSPTLVVPLRKPVRLEIGSRDVIHSFWVPQFGQKQDALPGAENRLVITPTKLGTFPVMCTELCGLGHALMRSQATVLRPQSFERWARRQAKAGG
jgi:cytochrome c oxidase subunit 2